MKWTTMHRLLQRFVVFIGWVFLLWWTWKAWAEQPCSTKASCRIHEQLVNGVAAVAANEGAFFNVKETALVWQVVEVNGGPTPEKQLAFLQRHSPHVFGLKPCEGGNCLWSHDLLHKPKAVPAWIAAGGKAGELNEDWWQIKRQPRWLSIRQYARALVEGRESWRPCKVPPRTWGGVGRKGWADDRAEAAKRGLYPLGCEGTLNDGFGPRT